MQICSPWKNFLKISRKACEKSGNLIFEIVWELLSVSIVECPLNILEMKIIPL